MAGTLWRWEDAGWTDTKLAMVGAPAVLEPSTRGIELFYRSPANVLMHASRDDTREPASWAEESLGLTIVSDPVAARSSDGVLTVAAVDPHYHPVALSIPDGGQWTPRWLGGGGRVVGAPALVPEPDLQLFVRGLDRRLHLFEPGDSLWTSLYEDLGGALLGFPTAIQAGEGARVYVRDASTGGLVEISRSTSTEDFATRDVAAPVTSMTGEVALAGSPSVSLEGDAVYVHVTTRSGSLVAFSLASDVWSATLVPSRLGGSPVSVGSQVFGAAAGRLWKYDGLRVERLGKPDVASFSNGDP
jgi:hypothetical protein